MVPVLKDLCCLLEETYQTVLIKNLFHLTKAIFFNISFTRLFLAVLDLWYCIGFPLVAASRGYSPDVARGLLIVVASLVVEDKLLGLQ